MAVAKKRIWGWMAFDWASQPYYTLGLTFIFGPYFASVATEYLQGTGLDAETANAQAQSIWSTGQVVAGLFIALTAPFLGAFADHSGRKIPWIAGFSVIYVIAAFSLWGLLPDSSSVWLYMAIFFVGFVAAESSLNFVNAILPSLGDDKEVGRISGSGAAFGYWGGVLSLILILLLLAENGDSGKTLIGRDPLFGLNADAKEGTRATGPFIAIWYALFMIPFFMWVRDKPQEKPAKVKLGVVARNLGQTLHNVAKRKSLRSFLLASMFYRDAVNALYAYGGIYAALVLGWEITFIGVFGVIAAIAAAITTWLGGLADKKYGPKPVIITAVWAMIAVSCVIVGMSREALFGVPLAPASQLPDIIFFVCGAIIGGAGGAVYASSRSLMVRHSHPDHPAEAFGLFALSGKATAFLAPAMIGVVSYWSGNVQIGFTPVLFLFIVGLFLLRWVNKDGDRAEWSA
ncbi:MFS transporter [Loktanella sp. D2R18]|uniref:MFS transporter n=1 Tax=Rhodobacterales TaxID=204455 RepID=UPI000DE8751B|nr:MULTISPECIES: MFS transporter [Rhodobacterales]MDO6591449.1 MFS transporter [Yoonia sp. 1_MG-2023]RBW43486.1 MFS transporter [Loktanella sp. D2R18]